MVDFSSYWSDQTSAYKQALAYIKGRQEGTITSFRTPWNAVNEAGVDGLEWSSLTILGGRPGTGKTLIKDQIVREAFANNPGEEMRVLEIQLEMVARVSKVREYSAVLGKSYRYICSAGGDTLTDADFEQLKQHARNSLDSSKAPVDIVEEAITVETFIKIVETYMLKHAIMENGKIAYYTKTVITLDHSMLMKMSKQHKSKTDMVYDLGEALTFLKRRYPIAFIVLSQLGRGTETYERLEDGKHGNYVLESDIFGGDALMQHADMVIGINRPGKRGIKYFGPERYIITDEDLLVFHYLKCRNGVTGMGFFQAEFDKMRITETVEPGKQTLNTSIL